eukprot:3775680-Amphidinium_carterae.1
MGPTHHFWCSLRSASHTQVLDLALLVTRTLGLTLDSTQLLSGSPHGCRPVHRPRKAPCQAPPLGHGDQSEKLFGAPVVAVVVPIVV